MALTSKLNGVLLIPIMLEIVNLNLFTFKILIETV